MSLRLRSTALGGAALWLALGAGQALSADANAIADALVAAMTASDGTQVSYQSATAIGDDITITGFTATNANGGTVTIPTLTIAGAQLRDPGGFTASRMTFDGGRMVDDDSNVAWRTGALSDATVPSPAEINAKAKIRPFSRVDIGGLTITGDELPAAIDISSIGVALDVDPAGIPRDFDMNVAAITVPAAVFEAEPQQKAIMDELGYTSGFVLDLAVSGEYETEGDILTLRNFTLNANDVGKLAIAGKFNGVSVSKIAEGADPGDLGSGSLESLVIRFDNMGVVERVLDMQARMMGVQREDVVAQFGGALPFMLNFLGNPPFQDKVARAGAAFLSDPQSITISVTPTQPVQFDQIMSTAGQAPQTLPDLLVVDINANN